MVSLSLMEEIIFSFVTFFLPKNNDIISINDDIIEYYYNYRKLKYIGTELPTFLPSGFFIPIKRATWNGVDVTKRVLPFAGPRHDFYGTDPVLSKMFRRIKKHVWKVNLYVFGISFKRVPIYEPEDGVLIIDNIFNQRVGEYKT
jgi:hypothetical protein